MSHAKHGAAVARQPKPADEPSSPGATSSTRNSGAPSNASKHAGPPRPRSGFVISSISVAAALLLIAGVGSQTAMLRVPAALWLALVGIGASVWAFDSGLGIAARLSRSFVVGWSLLAIGGALLARAGADLGTVFVAIGLLAGVVHAVALWRARELLSRKPPTRRTLIGTLAVVIALGAGLAVATAAAGVPGVWGLVRMVNPLWFVSLAALVGLAGYGAVKDRRLAAIATSAVGLLLTLSPALVYGLPRSQSAEKHVDLIRQVLTLGTTDSSIEVYNGWSGFFDAGAFISSGAGLADPIDLATYWPALIVVLQVAGLSLLFQKLTRGVRASQTVVWCAVLIALLANSIGADYFSPQSVGFLLVVMIAAIAVTPGGTSLPAGDIAVVVAGSAALAFTHQLSPFVLTGVLAVFAVGGLVRPVWLPAITGALTLGWALTHADAAAGFFDLARIGNIANFLPPITATAPSFARDPIIRYATLAIAVSIGLLALGAVATLLRRRDRQSLTVFVAAGVGVGGVIINPYGGEGIFRAILFAIPFLAVLAIGGVLQSIRPDSNPRPTVLTILGIGAVFSATFVTSAYALDGNSTIRTGDLDNLRYFQSASVTAEQSPNYLLNLGAGDVPASPPLRNYFATTLSRKDIDVTVKQVAPQDLPVQAGEITTALEKWVADRGGARNVYAIWSPASALYNQTYGLQTIDNFAGLRDALIASGEWTLERAVDGSFLLRLVNPPALTP